MKINGQTAKVLSESRTASMRLGDGQYQSLDVPQPPDKVTRKWIAQAIEEAKRLSADRITIYHYRYISYELRTVMRTRSGGYEVATTYSRENDWKATKVVKNDTY